MFYSRSFHVNEATKIPGLDSTLKHFNVVAKKKKKLLNLKISIHEKNFWHLECYVYQLFWLR